MDLGMMQAFPIESSFHEKAHIVVREEDTLAERKSLYQFKH